MRVPFENLASACVRLTENDDTEAWNWMVLNDLSGMQIKVIDSYNRIMLKALGLIKYLLCL